MARIPLDTGGTLLTIGSAPNDGTGDPLRTGGATLKQWAADINTMTSELYAALPPARYNYVRFGGGGTLDRLRLTSPGLAESSCIRGVVRTRFITATATGSTVETLCSIGYGTANTTQLLHLFRDTNKKLRLQLVGTGPGAASTTTFDSTTENYTLLLSYDGAHYDQDSGLPNYGKAMASIYNAAGVFIETIYSGGMPGATVALNLATEIAIGAVTSGNSNNATYYTQSALADVRLWLTSADNVMDIRGPRAGCGASSDSVLAGAYTLTGLDQTSFSDWSSAVPGVVLTVDDGVNPTYTLTVAANNGSTITFTSPFLHDIGSTAYLWETLPGTHIAEALATVPTTTGAINGRVPAVYFGGTQLSSDWNIGANQGTLAPFLMGGSVD